MSWFLDLGTECMIAKGDHVRAIGWLSDEHPFPLLFWGPFDDLTPFLVRSDVRKLLNRAVSGELIIEAWNQRWTLQQFMDKCLELPIEPPRPARGGWWRLNRLLGRQKPA